MHTELVEQVIAVRRFNRFYTRMAGFLNETLTRSDFTLTEARVLFELAHSEQPSAADIARDLGLDAAYLARILKKFGEDGLVASVADAADRRRRSLTLTDRGAACVADLQRGADHDIGRLLHPLSPTNRRKLVEAMKMVEESLSRQSLSEIALRPHQVGDLGWIIHRQARLYTEEYGWDIGYEGLIAEICGNFIRDFKPGKEFCWVAEKDGEVVGSVFLVQQDEQTGKLRLLYVEPLARGSGLGRLLVERCIEGARQAGYRKLVLWTNDILSAARRIYVDAGFKLVAEEKHFSFGKDLVGQNWELDL